MQAFQDWLTQLLAQLGYLEIFVLMALESSLFPVPSELVMIPAGYLAKTGALDPLRVVIAGSGGSLLGASVNYLIGRYLGRAFLLRYGKYLLVDERKYHEAEALFLRNAYVATFVGRLLPVVRHLISLPAGVFGMRPLPFALITLAGAAIWCSVLTAVGYYFGESTIQVVSQYTHEAALAVAAVIVVFGSWFLLRKLG